MTDFTPWSALLGGSMIGIASGIMLLFGGRIAGVSGIAGGLLHGGRGESGWRLAFLVGLMLGAWLYTALVGSLEHIVISADFPTLVVGGLLVGFGTRLGGGCTSGHGVCGISRWSARSIAATLLFMASAAATVFAVRHVAGASA